MYLDVLNEDGTVNLAAPFQFLDDNGSEYWIKEIEVKFTNLRSIGSYISLSPLPAIKHTVEVYSESITCPERDVIA